MIYRPVREREVDTILKTLKDSVQNTGHDETSLTSLSSGDYTALAELVSQVVDFSEQRHVSVSLPSLRPGTLTKDIIGQIQRIRKTGFTIAPEAGTQRLRNVINKKICEEDLIETVERVFQAGWETLKLYFMIGLPTETEEDLQGIVDLSYKALKAAKVSNPRLKQISVSISPFVPKPHTPLQWSVQDRTEETREKYRFLKKRLKNRKINFKWHEPKVSMLEGVFARGDRRLSDVLHKAWLSGCRFDGWTEEFDFHKWAGAFEACGIDPYFHLHRERSLDEVLPWDHIDSGISKDFLIDEYRCSRIAETTADCRGGECSLCGVCNNDVDNMYARQTGQRTCLHRTISRSEPRIVKRFRIRYTKEGRLRFISHLEMISLFSRAFARAGIQLEYSKGFHPHPKIAMGPALPVGVCSVTEFLDVSVLGSLFEDALATRLNRALPEEIRITGVNWIPAQAPAVSSIICFGEYLLRIPRETFKKSPSRLIIDLMDREEILVSRVRKGKERVLDIRPMIEDISVESEEDELIVLRTMIKTGDRGGVRLAEVLQAIFNAPADSLPEVQATRIGLFLDRDRTSPFQQKMVHAAR
jgi:radical SAM-linked protein